MARADMSALKLTGQSSKNIIKVKDAYKEKQTF